jgi:hypothetical protein
MLSVVNAGSSGQLLMRSLCPTAGPNCASGGLLNLFVEEVVSIDETVDASQFSGEGEATIVLFIKLFQQCSLANSSFYQISGRIGWSV